jgi:putative endonuclease
MGEVAAARFLERRGYRIVEHNYRAREGEIDLIALTGTTLVFCEVKTLVERARRTRGPNSPLEGVRHTKRVQVRRIARAWLGQEQRKLPAYRDLRFDAIGVLLSARGVLLRIDHVEAAF